ncbi:hypothetical protein Z946_3789 [Sulfitobacter noctilucicola]|nr:hypothetical protein Z946_3789 [Sulfitobacter noctilucicola]
MIMHIEAAEVVRMQSLEPQHNWRLCDVDGSGIVKLGMNGHGEPRVICFPQEYPIALKIPAQVAAVFCGLSITNP